jgi:UDP-N-acetylmuramoyl-L-alanyl-D-glutamate--2,6-diaminopimelate ligase
VPDPSGSSPARAGELPRPHRVPPRTITELAARLAVPVPPGVPDAAIVTGLTHDSRAVRAGDLYAALPGSRVHGARFVPQAVAAGAVAVLTDPAGLAGARAGGAPVLVVDDPRARLGSLAAWLYGEPAAALGTIGITGTDGKTTTAFLVEGAARAAGLTTGLVGTVTTRVAGQEYPAGRTTPEAPDLQALLAVMRERGVDVVALEVSSHALVMGRVNGLVVDVAVFTNLSQDHLDFHGTMEDYFAAKARLFTPERTREAVIWVDDPYGRRLAGLARGAGLPVTTVGTGPGAGAGADVPAGSGVAGDGPGAPDVVVEVTGAAGPAGPLPRGGQRIRLSGAVDALVELGLPGRFNAANAALALVALGRLRAARHLPVDSAALTGGFPAVRVPGRMEVVDDDELLAVVDFAHTPHAITTVLTELREHTPGRLLVVLGAGGDRDRTKRPAMGEAAARVADVVVVTDDNPRSEDPSVIRSAVRAGAERVTGADAARVLEVADRADAIARAVALAGPRDTVAVLGKGHEQGQEARGSVRAFDDRAALAGALRARRVPPREPAR